jgi:hypothetical protein
VRDRLRRDHRELRDGVPRPVPAPSPDVAAILRMQAGAGNAATSRLLAREEAKAPAQERTIVIEGVGTLPVLSFQLVRDKGVSVQLEDGPAGPKLFQASSTGTPFPSATLAVSGGHTLVLTDVLVMSFSYGGNHGEKPTISIELQGASREFK